MSLSIENQVLIKIKKARRGSLFFIDDFVSFGTAKTVNKALERLVDRGEIIRVARGIYTRPQYSKILDSPITPTTHEIAKAIARRDRARIMPTGVYAQHVLGLSTQIPLNAVYLTDGTARKISIGKRNILFKKTSPKNLSAIGEISGMIIQALKIMDKNHISADELTKIVALLKKEKPIRLEHDIRLAPEWIRTIMKEALPKNR
jgi:hypothetical protein